MVQNRLEFQQTQKLSPNMQTAIHLLSFDLDSLSEYMQKEVQENPALEYLPPQKSPQEYALAIKNYRRNNFAEYNDAMQSPSNSNTSLDELAQQLRLSDLPTKVCRVAESMLYMLSPRGYFTQDLHEFATEEGISLKLAQEALTAVQALEPVGIGARTVEECLELQLRDKEDVDNLCFHIVRMYLLEIGKGRISQIIKEAGAKPERIKKCVEIIRSLNPIPCSFYEGVDQYIMPEFSVEQDEENKLIIRFYNDYYPSFRQDLNFCRLVENLPEEDISYARKMLNSASQLIQAFELRQATMEKVARIITREQTDFFNGLYKLKPLRIDSLAQEIGVHESTIYRAIQNKHLYCSKGIFPLKHFFQREISEGISTSNVLETIKDICEKNPKISDREIAERLLEQGIQLSRRTVAKYRAKMYIGASFNRKQYKEQT